MQFSHGNPTDLATLTAFLDGAALVNITTHGGEECFAVTMAPGTAGAFAKLHTMRGWLKRTGYSVRSNLCGSTPSVLVLKAPACRITLRLQRMAEDIADSDHSDAHKALLMEGVVAMRKKSLESLHSPSTPHPSSHGLISGSGVGGESTYEPADVDLTACDCGGDTAYELADFENFATCRCCCSCGAPDSVVFDVHAITDDESDVEPYCPTCAVEDVKKMLAGGWPLESLVLRWLPMSDRALRLAAA